MRHDPVERTAEISFSDLPMEQGVAWVRRFAQHSAISFGGELTHEGWKDAPVSYLVCENDLCIPEKIQREEIDMIERTSGNKVDVTSIKAGHCPTISKPLESIDWILSLVGGA